MQWDLIVGIDESSCGKGKRGRRNSAHFPKLEIGLPVLLIFWNVEIAIKQTAFLPMLYSGVYRFTEMWLRRIRL